MIHREGLGLKAQWPPAGSGGEPGDPPAVPVEPVAVTAPVAAMLDDTVRSPDPNVCPFLRRDVDGKLFAPLPEPDANNRCAAIGVALPQSDRQQELVCLRAAHADCPRYLRGAGAAAEAVGGHRRGSVPRATLVALLILVLSAGISFGFVVQRGGIDLPVAAPAPSPSQVAAVATPAPTPSPSPSPSPSPAPSPSPSPSPTATPTPRPTSDRYALLEPCPDRKNCWIYVVRAGNNLYSIARYFGHPLSTIYRWNPRYAEGARLRPGDQIRMPPPTR